MAEAALRKLDQGLPRLDMRSPALRAKQDPTASQLKALNRSGISRSRMTERQKRHADDAMRSAMQAVERARELAEMAVAQTTAIVAEAERRADEIVAAARLEAAAVLKNSGVPVRSIIMEVAQRHGIDPALILGQCRSQRLVAIRHEAIALAHLRRPDLSLPQLGRAFHRDHTSILHVLRKTGAYLGRKAVYADGEAAE
ncbi:MAG: hypothetical protein E5W09_06305 [Mesorhizobium sp.]|nr:MAG: hypothetical protein E5W09_06305 [Mesorhizobium sp.]